MFAQPPLFLPSVSPAPRLPRWVAGKARPLSAGHALRGVLRDSDLATVCEEARCPNLATCFERGVATFMVLGDTCTRACGFCAVNTGAPAPPDPDEPERLARAAARMGLKHVVVTSVDRDDLPDGGLSHFASCVAALRRRLPAATVEVLTPDFAGVENAAEAVAAMAPDVFNHNLETVPRLYATARAGAVYSRSLRLLAAVKAEAPEVVTKSGLMVGLGETDAELLATLADLRETGCDVLTLGQYLRPTAAHLPVSRYLTPEAFAELKRRAEGLGFRHVAAGPRVRSSFNAATHLRALAGGEGRP
jgi:lipoic acid synthetase